MRAQSLPLDQCHWNPANQTPFLKTVIAEYDIPSKWRLFSEIKMKISTSDKFPIIYLSVNKFHHCVHFENVLLKRNTKRFIIKIWLCIRY